MDSIYKDQRNHEVACAAKDEFAALRIASLTIWPPVVLAPMAGVTNWPFRQLCRQFGAGLYVSEMITARPLAEGNAKTLRLSDFGEDESPRSLQLYGVDPEYVGRAVQRLVGEGRVDHIDMNFGCPVRKVTRRGGGSAIPAKPKLLANIVRAAVKHAENIPVTIKFRMGIYDDWLTYRDAGHIGESEGCAAVTLHARTAAQLYDGEARWEAIADLKSRLQHIPVLGNGDIWEAHDALRMMRQTGCDGVVVGRGCLGRPWLFRDLADVFSGKEPSNPPSLKQIARIMREHAANLCQWLGEPVAMRNFRRHATWYTKGFRGSAALRQELMRMQSLHDLDTVLAGLTEDEAFPPSAMRVPRGKSAGTQTVSLPHNFAQRCHDDTPPPAEAELDISGG